MRRKCGKTEEDLIEHEHIRSPRILGYKRERGSETLQRRGVG